MRGDGNARSLPELSQTPFEPQAGRRRLTNSRAFPCALPPARKVQIAP